MKRPAASSSSRVVTPGVISEPTCAIVSATSAPACAILSISRALFRMITSLPHRDVCERGVDVRGDLAHAALAGDRDEHALRAIALHDRLGLLVVVAETIRDRPGRVVLAPLRGRSPEEPCGRDL